MYKCNYLDADVHQVKVCYVDNENQHLRFECYCFIVKVVTYQHFSSISFSAFGAFSFSPILSTQASYPGLIFLKQSPSTTQNLLFVEIQTTNFRTTYARRTGLD